MRKKRICIVTNYSNTTNYGALLQAYALNRVINEMGYLAEDLYYIQDVNNKRSKIINQLMHGEINTIIHQCKSRIDKIKVKKQLDERKSIMDDFRLSIPHTRKINDAGLRNLSKEFDVFITGSDQVFRPNRNSGQLEYHYWLAMVDESCIKASYAASLGVEKLDTRIEHQATEYLESFNFISIRESSTAEYFKGITGRNDIVTSIDPVFLLDRNEWIQIFDPYNVGEEYILVYMIHGTEKLYKSIEAFSKIVNLKIITFPSMSYKHKRFEDQFGDLRVSDASPNQFIYLVKNSTFFFTDSFHGTAFSLILHKTAFISKANEIAFSRIENIISMLGADKLIIPSEGLTAEEYLRITDIDWDYSDKKIEEERDKALAYLRQVIENVNPKEKK